MFERFEAESNSETWFGFLEGWADERRGDRLQYDHWLTTLPELFVAWRWLPDYRELILATPRRNEGTLDLLLRPRVDPEQALGGIDAPPLPKIRPNWLLGELLRLGVLPCSGPLIEAAWPGSLALETVMRTLGLDVSRTSRSFSRRVFHFIRELLGPDRDPTFFRCFDKPLLSAEFQRALVAACDHSQRAAPPAADFDDQGGGWMGDIPIPDEDEGQEQ